MELGLIDKLGIDVSWHQGAIDWAKVKAAKVNGKPVNFVYIKATQGAANYSKVDYFRNNAPKALGFGFDVGAYHYFDGKTVADAKAQAKYFISVIKDYKLTLPPVLDLEEDKVGLSKGQLTDVLIAFLDTLIEAGYKNPILYTGDYFLDSQLDETRLIKYNRWIARYGSKPKNEFDIWQYTSSGKVDGIAGNVDIDIVYEDFFEKEQPTPVKVEIVKAKSISPVIKNIQDTLNNRYGLKIAEDGIYGNDTEKALLKGLQRELNKQYGAKLVIDGIWGAKTKAEVPTIRIGTKGNITWIVQARLFCLGFDPKGIDGNFGKGTANAVLAFQKKNGLGQDSIVGPNTFEKLFK
jgi:GH25 family lysozyme M1 (1,4-beta-N-acetylmuramidase)/peptidoglycan hydrolase-like protein with peptidoglycan-binding domain